MHTKKAVIDKHHCVACGCCIKICPMGAIKIFQGTAAQIDISKCVGCGKCAKDCPASVIEIQENYI